MEHVGDDGVLERREAGEELGRDLGVEREAVGVGHRALVREEPRLTPQVTDEASRVAPRERGVTCRDREGLVGVA